jgi:mannose-6-phosphate isomerase-like protein (cupin superfamily)
MLLKIEKTFTLFYVLFLTSACLFLIYSFLFVDYYYAAIPGWDLPFFPHEIAYTFYLTLVLNTIWVIYYFGKKFRILIRNRKRENVAINARRDFHISLNEKFSKFSQHWHPYIIGELNDNYIKLAKVKGDLVWHKHEHEDEMFVVLSGTLMMDFRDDKTIATKPGEILIVPKNTEHRPWTNDEEVKLMLVEPKATKHTGELVVEQTVTNLKWI